MIPAARYFTIDRLVPNLTDDQQWDLRKFSEVWQANRPKYDSVAQATNVPPQLIAAIHAREADCDFNTYLLQGDPLGTRTWADGDSNNGQSLPDSMEGTILYQPGQWVEAACFAIHAEEPNQTELGLTSTTTYLPALCAWAEMYNGAGYFNRNLPDPYVLSGTSGYKSGKFVSDHDFDPTFVDKELGVLPLLWKAFQLSDPVQLYKPPIAC